MTRLRVVREERDGIPVLRVWGRLTFGDGARALREAAMAVAAEGGANVLIDLAGVVFVDSSGLGALASSHNSLRIKGGGIGLFHVPKQVQDVLEMCRLTTVFAMFSGEAEAVAGTRAGRPPV